MVQRDFPKGKIVSLIYDLNISRKKMRHIPLKRGSNYLSNDMRHIFYVRYPGHSLTKHFYLLGNHAAP